MTLNDDLSTVSTTHLLNIWFSIMSNRPTSDYRKASNEERAAFYLRLGAEIDARIPARSRKEG